MPFFTSRKSRPLDTTMTVTAPKLFTDIHPIEASSLPRPESDEYQKHIDEIVAAATEVIESTPTWKSKGQYHHMVEVRERMDWRGKRNWFLRRSVHKDVSFETFKKGLLENHTVNEKEFIEVVKETKLIEAIEAGVLEIWLNSYHIPMFSDRDFLIAVYTPTPKDDKTFIVISRPVLHPHAPPQPHHTRGIYESIEFVRDLGEDGCEWLMATASSPEGNIPAWVSERAIPGQISNDVPAFLKWTEKKGWKQ